MQRKEELGFVGHHTARPVQFLLGRRRKDAEWQSRCVARRFRMWSSTFFFFTLVCFCAVAPPALCDYAPEEHTIGVNYGQVGDNLPAPAEAVKLITSLGIGRVRLFNPDAATLLALGGSGLQVVIGMGNDAIPPLTDAAAADQWVVQNVVPYVPSTNITTILLGNELFTDTTRAAIWLQLVPAMQNLRASLVARGLASIKLSTAAELNTLSWSYPPSKGVFRVDIAGPVLTPLFQFLNDTGSYFFVNVYPYFGWRDDAAYIPLDYALFTRTTPFITDANHSYYNLLDAQLDAIAAAMELLGFASVRLAISESGWPTVGSAGQVAGNASADAQIYNNNLVDYVLSSPTRGTPRRPGIFIPTYIFALFNEDLKPGGEAERNWGILYANGTQVYPLNLTPTPPNSPPPSSNPSVAPLPSVIPSTSPSAHPSAIGPAPGPRGMLSDHSSASIVRAGGLSALVTLLVVLLRF